jgi:hypothetical protein
MAWKWRRLYHLSVHREVKVVEGVDLIRRKMARNELLRSVHAEVSAVLREAPKVDMKRAKLPGDPEALRGIPAISRTTRGAIRHTQPEAETIRRLSRDGR